MYYYIIRISRRMVEGWLIQQFTQDPDSLHFFALPSLVCNLVLQTDQQLQIQPHSAAEKNHFLFLFLCLFVRTRKSSRLPQISLWREFYHILKLGTGKGNDPRDWFRSISVSPISLPFSPHPPLESISLKSMATLKMMAA